MQRTFTVSKIQTQQVTPRLSLLKASEDTYRIKFVYGKFDRPATRALNNEIINETVDNANEIYSKIVTNSLPGRTSRYFTCGCIPVIGIFCLAIILTFILHTYAVAPTITDQQTKIATSVAYQIFLYGFIGLASFSLILCLFSLILTCATFSRNENQAWREIAKYLAVQNQEKLQEQGFKLELLKLSTEVVGMTQHFIEVSLVGEGDVEDPEPEFQIKTPRSATYKPENETTQEASSSLQVEIPIGGDAISPPNGDDLYLTVNSVTSDSVLERTPVPMSSSVLE